MNVWRAGSLGICLAAAGIGAAAAPVATGQTTVRKVVRQPRIEVFRGEGRLGISIRDVEAQADKAGGQAGVVVEDVSADSPAEKAGFQKGDVIVEFDGERVRSARQFTRLVRETAPDRAVQTVVLRGGQRTTITVTPREGARFDFEFDHLERVGELARDFAYRVAPPPPPAPPGAPEPPAPPSVWRMDELMGRSGRLGITVTSLTPQLADYFGAKEGVLVTAVTAESVAATAGLKAGDVITAVNGSPVDDPAGLRRRVQALEDGEEFTIDVVRDRKTVTLKGKADAREPRRTVRTVV